MDQDNNKHSLSDSKHLNNTTRDNMEKEVKSPALNPTWERLDDHEERIQKLEKEDKEAHDCINKENWGVTKEKLSDHGRRITDVEKKEEKNSKDISDLDRKTYETYGEIMEKISNLQTNFNEQMSNLRGDLGLTKEHNNTQDEKIKGIQEEEKQKILNKGQKKGIWIGAIVGAVAGGLVTLGVMVAYRVIEIITFL